MMTEILMAILNYIKLSDLSKKKKKNEEEHKL